jgi:hypothetical protein
VVVAQEVLELKRDKEFMQKANDALADLGDGIATLTGLQVSQLSLVQGRPTAARHQPPSFFFSLSLSLSFFLSLSLSLSLSLPPSLSVCVLLNPPVLLCAQIAELERKNETQEALASDE